MMNRTTTARELFQDLRHHQSQASESQLDSGVKVEGGSVWAFRSSDGPIGLIIPTSQEEYVSFKPDTRSNALKLTKVISNGLPHVRLSLIDPLQEKIFTVFTDEVLAELESHPVRPSGTAAAMLQRWRRLFTNASASATFSQEQEIGLLCELEVLTQLLDSLGPEALDRWTGPEGLPHDFELTEESVECKATTSANGLRVSIHGITQLSPTPNKDLRLAVRRYIPDPDGQLSIPDICTAIYLRSDISVETFLEKLAKVNCPLFHEQSKDVFGRYTPAESFEFRVGEDFPRIRHIGPEQRVQQVSYVLDLSGPETVPGYQSQNRFLTDGGMP